MCEGAKHGYIHLFRPHGYPGPCRACMVPLRLVNMGAFFPNNWGDTHLPFLQDTGKLQEARLLGASHANNRKSAKGTCTDLTDYIG